MEPELFFFEQWLRQQRDAELRAAARARVRTVQPEAGARATRSSEAKEANIRSATDTRLVDTWKDIARSLLKLIVPEQHQ